MSPFSIVLMKPLVQVFLQGLPVTVYPLAESDRVELVQDGFVETLTDSVGLGRLGLRPARVDVIDRQVELVIMAVGPSAVFRAPIRQAPEHREPVLLVERQDPVVE